MSDQAYPGFASTVNGNDEFNRMKFVFDRLSNSMATAIPVKVLAVNGSKVDIQPAVNQLDAAGKSLAHGSINDVPVWRPRNGVSAIIIDPQVGDIGLAIFCHSDISSVKENKDVANPGSRRKFDYSDGVYLGGLFGDDPQQYIKLSGEGIELVAPTVSTSGNLSVGTGATGSFTDAGGQVITVVDGIVTRIA
jgi:hypothetical protein